jgi:hypothetical protein
LRLASETLALVELPVLHGRVVPSASEDVDFPSREAS